MRKKAVAKKSSFGEELIEAMKLVRAHQRDEIRLEQVWPKPIDVKAIRKRAKMSQAEFSGHMASASARYKSGSRAGVNQTQQRALTSPSSPESQASFAARSLATAAA